MPVQNSNSKISACPDFATFLFQILISTISKVLVKTLVQGVTQDLETGGQN